MTLNAASGVARGRFSLGRRRYTALEAAIDRRTFISLSAAAAIARLLHAQPGEPAAMPGADVLGRRLPRLGLGAYPLSTLGSEEEAQRVLLRAFDLGVRYIDTAPSYSAGESERRIGRALRAWLGADAARQREEFFIATKTLRRDADGAQRELEESLERLGLERVDSVQCHEVHDDWERLLGPGAVTGALERARDRGLVSHIGITAHRDPRWLLEAIKRYPFETALVPVNPIDVQHRSFVREFLPVAAEKKIPVIAMKVYGGGFLLAQEREDGSRAFTPADLLAYALAQPGVAVAVPGCDQVSHVEQAHAAVTALKALTPEELAELEARAGEHKGKSTERYKDP